MVLDPFYWCRVVNLMEVVYVSSLLGQFPVAVVIMSCQRVFCSILLFMCDYFDVNGTILCLFRMIIYPVFIVGDAC